MSTPSILFSALFAENPHLYFQSFKQEIDDASAVLWTGFDLDSLYSTGITLCNAEWNIIHPPLVDAEDPHAAPTVVPRPYPRNPPMHSNNAVAAVISVNKMEQTKFQAFSLACASLKSAILIAIGPTVRATIAHPTTGTIHLTVQDIVESLTISYGGTSTQVLSQLSDSLLNKFISDASFYSSAVTMSTTFARLAVNGSPKSEFDKLAILRAACSNIPASLASIDFYLSTHLARADQSFSRVTEHVRVHGPTIPTSNSNGFAAAASVNDKDRVQRLEAEIASLQASLASAKQQPLKMDRQHTRGRGGKGGRGKDTRDISLYCFYHGYSGHRGSDCKCMAGNAEYTDVQRQATSPSSVRGGA